MAEYKLAFTSYTYTGSGGFSLPICTKYWKTNNYLHKWKVGEIVFTKFNAIKGILEKVAIKQVKLISKKNIFGQVYFLYIDTNNSIYEENELISEFDALTLAKDYYQKQIAYTIAAIKTCN